MKIDAEKVLKPIQTRIKLFQFFVNVFPSKANRKTLKELTKIESKMKELITEEERKPENMPNYEINMDLFDEQEIYHDCTVQVLHNTVTDEYSVGWWDNQKGV